MEVFKKLSAFEMLQIKGGGKEKEKPKSKPKPKLPIPIHPLPHDDWYDNGDGTFEKG
jgi:hypothetical protein